jgi:hypothetical protein
VNDAQLAEKGAAIVMVEQPVILTHAGVGLIKEHEMGSPSWSEEAGTT